MSDPPTNPSKLESDELNIGRLRRRALAWRALATSGKGVVVMIGIACALVVGLVALAFAVFYASTAVKGMGLASPWNYIVTVLIALGVLKYIADEW